MVSTKQLETLMSLFNEDPTPNYSGRSTGRGNSPAFPAGTMIDIPAWVERHLGSRGISIVDQVERESGVTMYRLSACPWNPEHRHPDSIVGTFPSGGIFFRCLHNSCQDHTWADLRRQFEITTDSDADTRVAATEVPAGHSELPVINISDGQLRDAIAQVNAAILAAGEKSEPIVYVRDATLVRIIKESEHGPKIEIINPDAMRGIMTQTANFVKNSGTRTVNAYPPTELARVILKATDSWPFPTLRGVTALPIMRQDATFFDKPGYDAMSRLYYQPPFGAVIQIPDAPTREQAIAAATFVTSSLSDFPFRDQSSLENMLGLLITVVIKDFVGLAPMALIDAPIRGTGKTRLAQVAAIIATGCTMGPSSEIGNNEELRKHISAKLLEDAPIILIDNLTKTLHSNYIATILTTEVWSDRLLGTPKALNLPCRACWVCTGNNIRVGSDIGRRSYWIRLDSQTPRPWLRDAREFRYSYPSWFLANRNALVAAIQTMVKAWVQAGSPAWSQPPLGSYEVWSKTVGGILQFCGKNNFLENLQELYDMVDDEPMQWNVFFNAVSIVLGNSPFTINVLMERVLNAENSDASEHDRLLRETLPASLGDIRDKGFAGRFGLAIRAHRDQRFEVEGRILQLQAAQRDTHAQANRWKIVDISAS